MTIPEAIKTTEEGIRSGYGLAVPKFEEAVQLGIEALKRIEWYRKKYLGSMNKLLPGETEN